jgi:hypothetical protein
VQLQQKPDQRKAGLVLQEAVNNTTVPLVPRRPVREIGKVLPRVFKFMASRPEGQTILLSKVDLSDGFWRILVKEAAQWNFCYVMPDPPGAPVRIVVPSALQTGWMESPQYFCTATKTGWDFIQWLVDQKIDCPPHPLERFMLPQDLVGTIGPDKPVPSNEADKGASAINIYLDDYILAVVEDAARTLLRRITRATLYGVHSIFPPPEITEHERGKDPISVKKLEKGDATFMPKKLILGFVVNGELWSVQLPFEKAGKINTELQQLLKKSGVPSKRFLTIQCNSHLASSKGPHDPAVQGTARQTKNGWHRRAQQTVYSTGQPTENHPLPRHRPDPCQ